MGCSGHSCRTYFTQLQTGQALTWRKSQKLEHGSDGSNGSDGYTKNRISLAAFGVGLHSQHSQDHEIANSGSSVRSVGSVFELLTFPQRLRVLRVRAFAFQSSSKIAFTTSSIICFART